MWGMSVNLSDRMLAGSKRPQAEIVISVIIATFNACPLCAECLKSIAEDPLSPSRRSPAARAKF
jgi:hypothetical protein